MTQAGEKGDKTILITRPIKGGQKTANFLIAKNYQVFVCPLSQIDPCPFLWPDDLSAFDAICASSAAAFLKLEKYDKLNAAFELLKKQPLFCVGNKTAEVAQKCGFKNIAGIAKNADQLVSSLEQSSYTQFLYFAGKQRRPVLEDGLKAQKRQVTVIETYQTTALIPNADLLAKTVIFNAVLLYSTIGLNGLKNLDCHFNQGSRFLCLSKRIAQSLPQEYQSRAIIAHEPLEEDLLNLI